ncbi:MAG: hypothetical protein GY697_23365 [Desulfobacterales bacterium]|nr:hypothetical protein [Desulfobacterales bacterium]
MSHKFALSARIKCPDCQHEYLLAFSCRGRWFCPSYHNKKVVQLGHHLKETVLYPVPHRQYVFSMPKILRRFFLYDRKLLGKLSQCASKSLAKFFKLTLGKKTDIPVVVVSIQVSEERDSGPSETMPVGTLTFML